MKVERKKCKMPSSQYASSFILIIYWISAYWQADKRQKKSDRNKRKQTDNDTERKMNWVRKLCYEIDVSCSVWKSPPAFACTKLYWFLFTFFPPFLSHNQIKSPSLFTVPLFLNGTALCTMNNESGQRHVKANRKYASEINHRQWLWQAIWRAEWPAHSNANDMYIDCT